jgi:hypothetical protein
MAVAAVDKLAKRKASTSIRVNPNVRALRVYPIDGSKKTIDELQFSRN